MVADMVALRALSEARKRARDSVEANMASTVLIVRKVPVSGLIPDASGEIEAETDFTVYEGPARVGNATGPVTYTVGDDVQFYSSGSATIPVDVGGVPVDVWVNDLLQVTGSNDPVLAGRLFRVVDVEVVGTLSAGRRLQLVGIQRYPGWIDTLERSRQVDNVPIGVPPEWSV